MNTDAAGPSFAWIALCAVDELDDAALHRTEVDGRGLVVWRADDGTLNVWEDRCPHRGVRLSLGHHRGEVLQCQYHGWQFGAGDGACRFVPAHPSAAAPPVRVGTWPAVVRHGFVWTCVARADAVPAFPTMAELDNGEPLLPLRSVAIDADAVSVARALAGYRFDHDSLDPERATECAAFEIAPGALVIERLDVPAQAVVFLLQAVRPDKTRVHGAVPGVFAPGEALAIQRHHQIRLNALRDELEARRPAAPTDTGLSVTVRPASAAWQPAPTSRHASQPEEPATPAHNETADDRNRAFTVELARSRRTLRVEADASLLETLRAHGVEVPTSCEQGVCGTCLTRVLEGRPLHRDAWLTPDEQATGDCMLVCVSRARTDTLTLDL